MPRLSLAQFQLALVALILVAGSGCLGLPHRSSPDTVMIGGTNAPTLMFRNQPNHRPPALQKWNPVFWAGNMDEPVPPDWYRPEDPRRVGRWHRRNSFHNLTFYVIGVADKEFERTGRYPDAVFNPHGGWNWAVCRHRCVRLPFLSFQRGAFKFYFGWRERGNFGIKLTF